MRQKAPPPAIWVLGLLVVVLSGVASTSRWSAATPMDTPAPGWGTPCPRPQPTACVIATPFSFLAGQEGASGVQADPTAVAVELVCFSGQGLDSGALLEWRTATELSTAGFIILRSQQEQGVYDPVSEFIPHCDDGGLVGGYYLFQDAGLTNNNTYYYKLLEYESSTSSVEYGPIPVLPSINSPTPTASPTPSPSPSSTPTATPTATPIENPGGGGTQQPGSSPTATATASPGPSPTPTTTAQPSRTYTPTRTATARPPSTSTATPDSPGGVDQLVPSATPRPPTNTPLPTATRRVTSTPVPASPAGGGESAPASTATLVDARPLEVAQANTPTPGGLAPAATERPPSTDYPAPPEAPTAVPLPTDYVPPPTARAPEQLATMTPTALWLATGTPPESATPADTSPRLWLYVGFGLSLLVLVAALAVVLRHGAGQGAPEQDDGEPS